MRPVARFLQWPIVQAQPVHQFRSALGVVPSRNDAATDSLNKRVVAFRGGDHIRYDGAKTSAREEGRQQEHAQTALHLCAIYNHIPVELRMRCNDRGYVTGR